MPTPQPALSLLIPNPSDPSAPVQTLPGKPITLLSCDNLPENGAVTRTVVTVLAAAVDETLLGWVETDVDFASSMVDRITPASSEADREPVPAEQGYRDASPVTTEPFSEWVVSGRFPAGRPQWEAAGVTVVDDAAPFEQRKLSAGIRVYREALITRYTNPRIRHLLAQIAADGSVKLAVRTLPVVRAERSAGRMPPGCASTLGSWVLHLRGAGAPVKDVDADRFVAAATSGDLDTGVRAMLSQFDVEVGRDADFVDAVRAQAEAVSTAPRSDGRGDDPLKPPRRAQERTGARPKGSHDQ